MEVIETLTKSQQDTIEQATDKVTLAMLDSLECGDEIDLNSEVVVRRYWEDNEGDPTTVVIDYQDEEVFQVLWSTKVGEIIFEAL